MTIWGEILETQRLLDLALKESAARGAKWAAANAKYYTIKDLRVRELMDEGLSATAIGMIIKGEPGVNEAMFERDNALVEYENAKEARNVYKKKLDTLREEYEREWSRAGMSSL